MRPSGKKLEKMCVMLNCQNVRFKDKLLCHNHYVIRYKLYTYRKKYGDLKDIERTII